MVVINKVLFGIASLLVITPLPLNEMAACPMGSMFSWVQLGPILGYGNLPHGLTPKHKKITRL